MLGKIPSTGHYVHFSDTNWQFIAKNELQSPFNRAFWLY
jgi:hypothetical protein